MLNPPSQKKVKIAPKAILFDFDGVIGKTMEDNFFAWQKACHKFGKKISQNDYLPLEGMKLLEVAKKLCGANISDEDAEKIVSEKEANYLQKNSVILYPHVSDFLKKLLHFKIPFGLVTAGREARLRKSLGDEFLKQFSTVVFGDSTSRGKPFPDPYLTGAKNLGEPAMNCVVIENAPLGIKAAKSAGSYCIAITSTLPAKYLKEADEIIESFRALEEVSLIRTFFNPA